MADNDRDDASNPGGEGGRQRGDRPARPRGAGGDRGGFGQRDRGGARGGSREGGFARGGSGGHPPGGGGGGGGFNRNRGYSGQRRSPGAGGYQDRPFRGGDRPDRAAGSGYGDSLDRGERPDKSPDRPADWPWSDRPPRSFERGQDRGRGDRGAFARDDRPRRNSFADGPGRSFSDRPFRDRSPVDRGSREYGDRPPRPYGDRPPRPYGDRPGRPPRRFGADAPREGFSRERGSGAARPVEQRPPDGGWQERGFRSDRGQSGDRGGRPSGGQGTDRPSYRSGPRTGGDSSRLDRNDRFGPRSWQDRVAPAAGSSDPEGGQGLAAPDVLAEDEELVAGRRPVAEAFAARRPAKRLLVVPDRRQALEQLVLHATALRIPVVEVEGGTLSSVSGFDGHQGIALVVEPRRWATLDDVIARAMERAEAPLILVLDSLEDPQNVGTLLRTAEANGVHGVIFPTRRSAPISPAAIKTSAGATEHLLLVPLDDLAGGLVDLRSRGLRVIGADEDAPLSYRDADLRGPLALVVGSEGQGISGPIHRRLDLAVRIPMRGKVASLNAAVAGSVLLFEAASQRGLGETDRATTSEYGALLREEPSGVAALEAGTTEAAAGAGTTKPARARKPKVRAEPRVSLDSSAAAAVVAPSEPLADQFEPPQGKLKRSRRAKDAPSERSDGPDRSGQAVAVEDLLPDS